MSTINQLDSHLNIIDNVEWTDPFLSLESYINDNSQYWSRSDINPEIGQKRLILISGYWKPDNNLNLQVGGTYYFFFQPGLSSINGYEEEYIEEINNFFVVNATIEREVYRESELWRSIEINSAINLANFTSLIKPQEKAPKIFDRKEYFSYKFYPSYVKYNNWLYVDFAKEYWWLIFIFCYVDNELILVFCNEDYCSTEQSFITNYKLTEEECELIYLALQNPDKLVEQIQQSNSSDIEDKFYGIWKIIPKICKSIKKLFEN